MIELLLICHLVIASLMVFVVLVQKSEGGALGISGSGGGAGGFLTGRGSDNALSRTTAGLALAFFATSLLLSVLPNLTKSSQQTLFDSNPAVTGMSPLNKNSLNNNQSEQEGILDALKKGRGGQVLPSIPQGQ
ncbi:MAG TPA: hypothetical protein TECP_01275 [Hyphomicrobiaceae bacterium MAG_BT-2024]